MHALVEILPVRLFVEKCKSLALDFRSLNYSRLRISKNLEKGRGLGYQKEYRKRIVLGVVCNGGGYVLCTFYVVFCASITTLRACIFPTFTLLGQNKLRVHSNCVESSCHAVLQRN